MAGKTSRILVWIILGLVMVGLVGFGSANFGGTIRSVGTVGDTEIDAGRYFRELSGELNAYQAQFGQTLPMAQAQALGIDRQVLARVIATTALEGEAAKLGFSVGDAELRRQLVGISSFQGIDGKFDRDAYDFGLDQMGVTASEFETSLRAEISRTILQAAVSGGVTTAPTFTDSIFNYAREARDFTWAPLAVAALASPVPEPAEDALTTYYEAHPGDFTLPETRKITYAWLNPEDLIGSIDVDEAELRALYDERSATYAQPERRLVERLVFPTLEEAQTAADNLAAGGTGFDALVTGRGLSLSDVDLGDVSKSDLGAAGDAVFALTEPGIAGPAQSDLGPALYRMNAILAAQETPFEDAREELQGEYVADRARRQVADLIPEIDDLMAGGATLEDLANEQGLTLGQIDWALGKDTGIAAYESFREAALAAQDGDFPEVTMMEDGGAFALRLDERTEPRLQPLEEVRAMAIAGWKEEEAVRLLKTQAEAYVPRLTGGENLAALGLTETIETGQMRSDFIENTPPGFLTQVFEMTPGDWRVIENVEGVVLVRLDGVTPADADSEEARAMKTSFSQGIAQELALDMEIGFATALQNEAGITLNQQMINAIHSNFP